MATDSLVCVITTRVRVCIAWLRPKRRICRRPVTVERPVRVLVLVEGLHDAEFLKRISLVLQDADPTIPNLVHQMERMKELIFIPTSGNPAGWANRLSALRLHECHLLDGETPPTTAIRQRIAATINKRAGLSGHSLPGIAALKTTCIRPRSTKYQGSNWSSAGPTMFRRLWPKACTKR